MTRRQQHVICAITRVARRRLIALDGPADSRLSAAAGLSCRISSSGARPHTTVMPTPAAQAAAMPRRSGANTRRSASWSKKSAGIIRTVHAASSIPNAPPVTEMTTLSESSCVTSRPRAAPSATRTDISCERTEARASRNKATFAQATRNTAPAATRSSVRMRETPPVTSGVMPV